ncbi:hypothetical protein MAPG_01997 [Magnaporthiopsis poae ATCC 64411]|uniref:Uncharacterized protein n=1 Tax=Magnaporthiopsis poae (strain ATCC 64411 / 73-15) TaxID=644358 RepID=A0A0C4DQ59_MAGP6|nr:hypothetical protein MAPG_01997 [Magnaporthiopsis poae ATCC 64411]
MLAAQEDQAVLFSAKIHFPTPQRKKKKKDRTNHARTPGLGRCVVIPEIRGDGGIPSPPRQNPQGNKPGILVAIPLPAPCLLALGRQPWTYQGQEKGRVDKIFRFSTLKTEQTQNPWSSQTGKTRQGA